MKVVVQKVRNANVSIDGGLYSSINYGLLLFVGITHEDNEDIVLKMAEKIVGLRIFEDVDQKMNLSVIDVGGQILSVSQFTLYANCKKGKRPSFIDAAHPNRAKELYDYFNDCLMARVSVVKLGIFGADMCVGLENDGPVTIILDSDEIF